MVEVGDQVEVRRLFIFCLKGVVVWVYDPSKPSPPRGDNDYGISIKLKDGSYYWGLPDKNTVFKGRRATQ
jgi:hypothetical protein